MNENPNRIPQIRFIYFDNSQPTSEIQSSLLELNPTTQFFTNIQSCIDFIKSIVNEQIFLIISNTDILDSIHSLQSIIAIFIYKNNQSIDELKIKYPKIIDVYSNPNGLFKSLQEKLHFFDEQIFLYTFFDSKQKSYSFIWYQMLINILKQFPKNESLDDEILNKYSNSNELKLFHQTYQQEQTIQFYTNEYFLSKLLNHALYTKDIGVLYLFRFFIIDLEFAIDKEYENMKNHGSFIVYRAQIMSNEEIKKFQKNIGCFISTNMFLPTSRDKNISLALFKQHLSTNENNVLLEIYIDLSKERILCIDTSSFSSKDILFNINSLFKIDFIQYDSTSHLWNIKLIAYNESLKSEIQYDSPMIYFGYVLWNKLNQIDQARNYFQILLQSLPNDHADIPRIYMELGNVHDETGEYNIALNNYQYALDIHQKQIPKDYLCIALLFNSIGIVYKHMNNIDQAIDYYRQSLDICEDKCSKDEILFHRANVIDNLGLAYRHKYDIDTAITYFTLAYNIRRDILPNDHPVLVNSLNSLGNIYYDKEELNQALYYYQQALAIQETTDPDDHLNKANTLRNIGIIHRDKHEWQDALNYFNRSLEMRQRLLTDANHRDIAICYGDVGYIYEKMNNLDLALDYYRQQLGIEEQYLPMNHSDLIVHFDLIINILKKKDQSEKALELCQEKLLTLRNLLGNEYENHLRIARLFLLIATIYEDKNPLEADQYYQKALVIFEYNKNEDIFQICLPTMTNFYWKCRMFDRALICQMKLLNLRRRILSSNHNDIAYALQGLARLYRAMNKSTEALEYFNQSLKILQTNYGPEHIDVKNIQKEIFDLKDIIKSISANANEDYNHRRSSNVHKQSLTTPPIGPTSQSSTSNSERTNKLSILKSTACVIL